MKYHFYTVSADAWDAMLIAIRGAQISIFWECYILVDDTLTHNFFEVLKEKASRGVKVKIIADAVGSFWLSSKIQRELMDAGVEILFFNHLLSKRPWRNFRHWWFNRNHKKILIIDEKIGFIGGVNIAKKFINWLDLHVRLQGVVVRSLLRSFIRSYLVCGGKDPYLLHQIKIFKKTQLRLLEHWPFNENKQLLRKYYTHHLNNAQKSIFISTPYFFPHWWLIKSLRKAARRGVKIEIILPRKSDWRIADWVSKTFVSLVKEFGIDFYFTKQMIHAKSLLVDDKEGLIGSNNIDAVSFDRNVESSLVFQRKDMLRDLKIILEKWKNDAEKFDSGNTNSISHKILAVVFRFIQPIL